MAASRRLSVLAGQHRMTLDVARVREVLDLPEMTTLPNGPPAALGLAVLRGELTPVVDLARLIDGCVSTGGSRLVVLVEPRVGLVIDEVEALMEAGDDASCSVETDGVTRPFDLERVLGEAFDQAWRQARTAK
ncbi:chemotaxis protein CheW [Caulobacter segnis]|uniref:chemotaxis protein CheW n=1 Tax=Caulobacter segnis TaxID=88688 RepID=UPI00240FBD4B|nr:chemotaxis protein CheW [Caulobacter segnis]MDG2522127.1 chemotaxis protein CheW [Caulobacter segnis]